MKGIKFLKYVDAAQARARIWHSSLPTLKFFCAGREIGEMIGALPKGKLEAAFREVIAGSKECLAASSPAKSK